MSVDDRMRIPALLTAGALLLGGIAGLAHSAVAPAAPSATASVPTYDTGTTLTEVAATSTVRTVELVRCTKYQYVTRTRTTLCLKGTRAHTTARFIGSIVQSKAADGSWVRVPYVWDAKAKALVYSRWLDLQLHRKAVPDPTTIPQPAPPQPAPTQPAPAPTSEAPAAVPAPGASTIAQPDGVGVSPTPWLNVPGDAAAKASSYAYFPQAATAATAAHWDRCTTIRWTVDLTRITQAGSSAADELSRWTQIMTYASHVTGYTFQYVPGDGKVTIDPALNQPVATAWSDTGADIVISYVSPNDPGAYRSTAVGAAVVGRAGPWYSLLPGGVKRIFKAYVQLAYEWLPTASETDHYNLLFHEFGHALGLAHVGDPTQVMNPYIASQDTYRLGDRTGLWQLAQDACISPQG